IVRTDPFGGVNGALFQCRENIAAGDLLRDHAKFRQHPAWEAADAEFQTLEVINCVDLLAEPSTHLTTSVGSHQRGDVELLVEVVQKIHPATMDHPCLVLALIGAKRDRSAERECRI